MIHHNFSAAPGRGLTSHSSLKGIRRCTKNAKATINRSTPKQNRPAVEVGRAAWLIVDAVSLSLNEIRNVSQNAKATINRSTPDYSGSSFTMMLR